MRADRSPGAWSRGVGLPPALLSRPLPPWRAVSGAGRCTPLAAAGQRARSPTWGWECGHPRRGLLLALRGAERGRGRGRDWGRERERGWERGGWRAERGSRQGIACGGGARSDSALPALTDSCLPAPGRRTRARPGETEPADGRQGGPAPWRGAAEHLACARAMPPPSRGASPAGTLERHSRLGSHHNWQGEGRAFQ